MIILEMYDGEVIKLNLPGNKEKALHDLWHSIISKKVKVKTEDDEYEITLSEISNCLIGDEATNYKKKQFNFDPNSCDMPDIFKDIFTGKFNYKS